MPAEPEFFKTPRSFRAWLRAHHATAPELLVGFHRVGTGVACMTWPESVAEALCFGWIDGVRRRLDKERYSIRFTPRRPGSRWSAVNIRLVAQLEAARRMMPAGRAAFDARRDKGSKGYVAQKKDGTLDAQRLRRFKDHKAAWEFFQAQPPGYRRAVAWWVMQARQDATRKRRLEKLITASAAATRLG